MNTRVVKSFGLALLVAVGILALMLALGTFTSQKAGAAPVADSGVSLSLEQIGSVDQDGINEVKATVKFTDDEALMGQDAIVITLAGDLDVTSGDLANEVTVSGTASDGKPFTVTLGGADVNAVGEVITIGLPVDLDVDDTERAAVGDTEANSEITVVIADGITAPIATDDQEFTAAVGTGADADTNVVTSDPVTMIIDADVLSSQDAGAGVSVTIEFTLPTTPATGISAGDDVVIEMKSFQFPDDIDPDAISIRGETTANAADASASGEKITVEIPDMDGNVSAEGDDLEAGTTVTIRVRSRAEIMNPTLAGDGYRIKVTHGEVTLYERSPGPINATLEVAPTSGIEGDELTVSGVGYSTGTATIYHAGDATPPALGSIASSPEGFTKVGSAIVSDGSFSTSITAGDTFKAAGNDLIARSSTGEWGPTFAFTLNGAISIADSVTKGTDLTVKVSKWSAGDITRATINGEDMYTVTGSAIDMDDGDTTDVTTDDKPMFKRQPISDDYTAEFKIRVGSGALLGEQTLVLYATKTDEDGMDEDEESAGQKNINIIGIDLTVSPSTAVVGREVTVTGSGFTNGESIMTLKVGGVDVLTEIAMSDRQVASGGRVVAAFLIPDHADLADADDYTIELSDGTRTGSATVTIPERTLTVDPTESRIGSPINLSGDGWPTGTGANLVGIYYDGKRYGTATSNSSGSWSASITVPDDAGVGMTHEVAAKATVGGGDTANVTKEVDHKTPAAVVTLSSGQAQRGTTITVSGENFNTYHTVRIDIGESNVTPAPAPTTDGDGSFSDEVLVPGLSLGNKNLKVTVKGVPVVEFLEIVDAPAPTVSADPSDVFADLIEAGTLVEVLQLIRTSDTDITWLFYKPGEMFEDFNTYSESESGDILFVNVSSQTTFQGKTLYTGWNQHVLD